MKLAKFFGLGLMALLTFSGCGSNNSDAPVSDGGGSVITPPDDNISNPAIDVILPVSSTVLTTNSQVVTIDVRAFDSANNPYSEGNISIINSPDVKEGRDVGSFDKYSSAITNGTATFTYTAPASLETNTSSIYFGFYHDSNSSNLKTYTMSIVPETNQTIIASYKIVSSNAEDVEMNLESIKSISYTVYDDTETKLSDDVMTSITVTSLNPSLVKLSDSLGNDNLDTLTLADKNTISVNLSSNTKSGLAPLKVETTFTDANGDEQNLTEVYSIVILSGPPTAMSLSYAGTSQDSEHAKFIEDWVLTVTDKYNNLVNTKPTISTGMIVGYAQSSAPTSTNIANYLYSTPPRGGSLVNATPDEFHAVDSSVFNNVDFDHDYLVTFGNGYTYDASGKWDIEINSANVVNLVESYDGLDTSDLGFAVGNNYRQDTCSFGDEWVANVYPENSNYILDGNGSVILKAEYDYYLVGKDAMLWVNLIGQANNEMVRVGEAKKVTLRGLGLTGESYAISKGFQGLIRLEVLISETAEYYKNANFGYHVEVTADDTNWTISGSSMTDGNITDCTLNSGVGYVDVNVTDPAGGEGSVSLTNVLVADEF